MNDHWDWDNVGLQDPLLAHAWIALSLGELALGGHGTAGERYAWTLSPNLGEALSCVLRDLRAGTADSQLWRMFRDRIATYDPVEGTGQDLIGSLKLPVLPSRGWEMIREVDRRQIAPDDEPATTCSRLLYNWTLVRIKAQMDSYVQAIRELTWKRRNLQSERPKRRTVSLAHWGLAESVELEALVDTTKKNYERIHRLHEDIGDQVAAQTNAGPDARVAQNWKAGSAKHGCREQTINDFFDTIPKRGDPLERTFGLSPKQWLDHDLDRCKDMWGLLDHLGVPALEPFEGEHEHDIDRHLFKVRPGPLLMDPPTFSSSSDEACFMVQVAPGKRQRWLEPELEIEELPWKLFDAVAQAEGFGCWESLRKRVRHVHIARVGDEVLNVRIFGTYKKAEPVRGPKEILAQLENFGAKPENT